MKKILTRRSLLRAAGLAAPALILPPSLLRAQFDGCAPGLCGAGLVCASGGGAPIGVLDGLGPTGAWSASRKLLTAFGGSFYTLASGRTSTIFDQSGSARNLTPADQGAEIGCYNPTPFKFTDPDHTIMHDGVMSNLITTTAGYMIVSIVSTGFPTINHSVILGDNSDNAGINIYGSGASGTLSFNLWDGGQKDVTISPISTNVPYVVEWRHEAGVLYGRLNGAGEVSTAAGTITGFNFFNFGGKFLASIFDGYIFEAATFNVVPNLATRDALVQSFGTYIGAAV